MLEHELVAGAQENERMIEEDPTEFCEDGYDECAWYDAEDEEGEIRGDANSKHCDNSNVFASVEEIEEEGVLEQDLDDENMSAALRFLQGDLDYKSATDVQNADDDQADDG